MQNRALQDNLVEAAAVRLRERYAERFAGLAVRTPAPGPDLEDDMDIELLVILLGEFDRYDEIIRVGDIASDLGIEHALAVAILPVSEAEFAEPGWGYRALSIKDAVRVV